MHTKITSAVNAFTARITVTKTIVIALDTVRQATVKKALSNVLTDVCERSK